MRIRTIYPVCKLEKILSILDDGKVSAPVTSLQRCTEKSSTVCRHQSKRWGGHFPFSSKNFTRRRFFKVTLALRVYSFFERTCVCLTVLTSHRPLHFIPYYILTCITLCPEITFVLDFRMPQKSITSFFKKDPKPGEKRKLNPTTSEVNNETVKVRDHLQNENLKLFTTIFSCFNGT